MSRKISKPRRPRLQKLVLVSALSMLALGPLGALTPGRNPVVGAAPMKSSAGPARLAARPKVGHGGLTESAAPDISPQDGAVTTPEPAYKPMLARASLPAARAWR